MNIYLCYNAVVLIVLCYLHGTKGKLPLEIIVEGKVTSYGQDLILFCKINICCQTIAGWEVNGIILFIDITKINLLENLSYTRYKASYNESGIRLVIQNFSRSDINISHKCFDNEDQANMTLYLDDVFSKNTPKVNDKNKILSFVCMLTGVVIGIGIAVAAVVMLCYCCLWRIKKIIQISTAGRRPLVFISMRNR